MQVKGQSEQLSAGYSQLQEAHADVERQQQQLQEQHRHAETERKATKADRAEAEAAAQQAAEARLEAAAERRKLGQERLESMRAAEAVRALQMRLAAHVSAAVAAQVPQATELWAQLHPAVAGIDSPLLLAEGSAQQAQAQAQAWSQAPSAMQPAPAALLVSKPAVAAAPATACAAPVGAPPAAAAAAPSAVPAIDDSTKYRAMLADLESSISRWRGQLRAGEPMTFGGSTGGSSGSPLGGASFFMPASLAGSPASPAGATATAGACSSRGPVQQREQPAACMGVGAGGDALAAVELSSPSSRAVQTAVSYLDAPRAVLDAAGHGHGASAAASLPCSPAAQRGGIAAAALDENPGAVVQ